MIRTVLDVTEGILEVVEVNDRSVTTVGNVSLTLQVQIGSFQVGHAFRESAVETWVFNDDGTLSKKIMFTEDGVSYDMMEWAERTLKGMGDYLKVDCGLKRNERAINDIGCNSFDQCPFRILVNKRKRILGMCYYFIHWFLHCARDCVVIIWVND